MDTSIREVTMLEVLGFNAQEVKGSEPISSCMKFVDLLRAPGIRLTDSP